MPFIIQTSYVYCKMYWIENICKFSIFSMVRIQSDIRYNNLSNKSQLRKKILMQKKSSFTSVFIIFSDIFTFEHQINVCQRYVLMDWPDRYLGKFLSCSPVVTGIFASSEVRFNDVESWGVGFSILFPLSFVFATSDTLLLHLQSSQLTQEDRRNDRSVRTSFYAASDCRQGFYLPMSKENSLKATETCKYCVFGKFLLK